ncbi:MAG TPA: MFS transporter [Jiangellaceae bacterium]|nr:MFS transporter [Jiangellaceae bacterium]
MSVLELARVRRHFLVLSALRWFPVGLVIPVMVLLFRARGLDITTVAVVMAGYSVTTAVCELPTGGLADVLGRRPVLIAASGLFVAQFLVLGLGQSVPALAAGAVVGGLARALDSGPLQAWYVEAVHSVDRQADLKPGLARGEAVEAGALGVGALAGGALASLVPMDQSGGAVISLSVPFLAAAAIGLVHVVALVGWVHDSPREHRRSVRHVLVGVPTTIATGVRMAGRPGTLRRLTIFSACLGVTLASVELLSPVSFAQLLGSEVAAAGPYSVLVTLAFFGTAVGSTLAPGLARLVRSSPRGIALSMVLAALALVGIAAPSFALAAVAYVVMYALLGLAGPLASDLTHRAVPSTQRATILSVQSLTLQLSGVVAGLSLGALAQNATFVAAFGVAAAVLALGSTAFVRMHEPTGLPSPAGPQAAHGSADAGR